MLLQKKKKNIRINIFILVQNLITLSLINIITSFLFNINPSILFLFNGIMNLLHIFLYKNIFPFYFAPNLILTAFLVTLKCQYQYLIGIFLCYGLIFCILSFVIKKYGFLWLNFLFPNKILGVILIITGLNLSNIFINMVDFSNWKFVVIFLFTFLITFISSLFLNKFLFFSTFLGLISGYILSIYLNVINVEIIYKKPWFYVPKIIFINPKFSFLFFLLIIPIIFISLIEYISFLIIINKVSFKKINLNKFIFLNGFLNIILSFYGSISFITYSDNVKLILMNKILNSNILLYITSLIFILMSFIGKLSIILQLIPIPVIAAISLFIYGIVIISGLKTLLYSNIDFDNFQNVLLIFITFILGISKLKLIYKNIEIKGLILTIIISMFLNLFFRIINIFKN